MTKYQLKYWLLRIYHRFITRKAVKILFDYTKYHVGGIIIIHKEEEYLSLGKDYFIKFKVKK